MAVPAGLDSVSEVSPDELLLDPENPRLAEHAASIRKDDYSPSAQRDLLILLWNAMAVSEIADPIAANGYFRYEPLFAERRPAGLVVIEGNRRLAAVKLLRMPATERESLGVSAIGEPTPAALATLDPLPVVVGTRDELWTHIGYKHVHGAQPWTSLSKAQYIDHLHREQGIPLAEIALKIGDKRSTVERIYRGYRVLLQAEKMGVFTPADCNARRGFSFSHLYTAVHRAGFQRYLALRRDDLESPVPEDHRDELRNVMLWLFGSKTRKIEPALKTQSPDLNHLDDVLQSDRAIIVLVRHTAAEDPDLARGLAEAHERTQTEYNLLVTALDGALDALEQAHAKLPSGYRGEAIPLAIARDVVASAQDLVDNMERAQEAVQPIPTNEETGDGIPT